MLIAHSLPFGLSESLFLPWPLFWSHKTSSQHLNFAPRIFPICHIILVPSHLAKCNFSTRDALFTYSMKDWVKQLSLKLSWLCFGLWRPKIFQQILRPVKTQDGLRRGPVRRCGGRRAPLSHLLVRLGVPVAAGGVRARILLGLHQVSILSWL